ncbi:ABC transporter ATP-binding protein [Delftia acidovorans]|uniref:ABC transporter ATP-binding protein n=1 Tax=Delftia acidovorans TaxID=80866 RepID=UPI0030164453
MTPIDSPSAARQGMAIELRQLRHNRGGHAVLQGIHLQIAPGEVLALLGPAHCGKTTMLRLLAGREAPHGGEVWMDGRCLAGAGRPPPPGQHELGLVLQDHALWPQMSLQANVAFALEMRGLPRAQIHERVQQTLGLVGLQGMGERLPGSLSGGQQQRAALACALVERPRLVLLDEPLSGLDCNLRERLCEEIPRLLRSLGCTAVYATQDRQQAFAVADRVVVMEHGRILQPGSARGQPPALAPCEADRWPTAGHLCSAA